jgi:DNA (cytosine-5)-methyltransferase 1
MTITIGSLFSGIGGLDLGLELAIPSARVIWQCERALFPRAILEDRYPGVRIYRDVRDIDARAARPDLICGGFPCQDVSVAGEGAGLSGERSGLWWEFRRIVRELRPDVVFIENVHAGWRRWLPIVRRSLWRVGYASLPLRVLASDVGAPHKRARCFVLAYAGLERLEEWALRRGGDERTPAARGRALAHAGGIDGAPPDQEGRPRRRDADRGDPGAGDLADAHRRGRESLGLAQQAGLDGKRWGLADRLYPAGWQLPPGPDAIHGWDGPQPAVRRAPDDLSRWVGRAQLEALGNAVVPVAAAHAWRTLIALALAGRAVA